MRFYTKIELCNVHYVQLLGVAAFDTLTEDPIRHYCEGVDGQARCREFPKRVAQLLVATATTLEDGCLS